MFRGTKDYSAKQVQDMLCLGKAAAPGQGQGPGAGGPMQGPGGQPVPPANKFLQPVHKCDMSLTVGQQ